MYDFYIYCMYLHTGSTNTGGDDMVLRTRYGFARSLIARDCPVLIVLYLDIITVHIQYAKFYLIVLKFCFAVRSVYTHTYVGKNVLETSMSFVNREQG